MEANVYKNFIGLAISDIENRAGLKEEYAIEEVIRIEEELGWDKFFESFENYKKMSRIGLKGHMNRAKRLDIFMVLNDSHRKAAKLAGEFI